MAIRKLGYFTGLCQTRRSTERARLGRLRQFGASVALGAMVFGTAAESWAFKSESHGAVAALARQQVASSQWSDDQVTIHFDVDGKTLDVPVDSAIAYRAILDYPEYFMAGATGSDSFPDLISGQWFTHGNETKTYKDVVKTLSGTDVVSHNTWDKLESRAGVAEYRAIDFPVAMLAKLVAEGLDTSSAEYRKTLAFIVGYFSHAVTDGFSHTWANEYTEQAWSLTKGQGILGALTEEIQHIAVETMLDKHLPTGVLATAGDGNGYGMAELRAPNGFLDAFYAEALPQVVERVKKDPKSNPSSYIDYYSNVDLFRGGIVYSILNAQLDLLPAAKSWSKVGFLFDIAEKLKDNDAFQALMFFLDLDEVIEHEIEEYTGDLPDPMAIATFGWADCSMPNTEAATGGNGDYQTALSTVVEILGGINDRVAIHGERARVARLNYNRLSECTAENMMKLRAGNYSPDALGLNTDACADIVRAGWVDEGSSEGLDRGSLRANTPGNREFLTRLKADFLGGEEEDLFEDESAPWESDAEYVASETYEYQNKHRSAVSNVTRLLRYLRHTAATVGQIDHALFPDEEDSDKHGLVQAVCADVRRSELENCIDIKMEPIAVAARQAVCEVNFGKCTVEATKECLRDACNSACDDTFVDCNDLCGEPTGCRGWCKSNMCWEECALGVCINSCEFSGGYVTKPLLEACNLTCDVIDAANGDEGSCTGAAVCGVEEVVCSFENVAATFDGDFLGDDILGPARKLCDTIDAVKAFAQCMEGDPSLSEVAQENARKTCMIDACTDVIDEATGAGMDLPDVMTDQPPRSYCTQLYNEIHKAYDDAKAMAEAAGKIMDSISVDPEMAVNVLFIEEDIKKDPDQSGVIRDELARKRSALSNQPVPTDPAALQLRNDQILILDNLLTVTNGGTPTSALPPARAANAMSALMTSDWPLPRGYTLRSMLTDLGPKIEETFLPFFNSIQGTKLAPMVSPSQIEDLFEQQGVGNTLLPWSSSYYSNACSGSLTSLYCDVVASFDDPNCIGPECDSSQLQANSTRNDWVPGRSVVAYNKYNPETTSWNVLTNFPLASTQSAYEMLYRRIFRVPSALPAWFGFDDENAPWTSQNATLAVDYEHYTQGIGSLSINGCNNLLIQSPVFRTVDIGVVGPTLAVDMWVPTPSNIYYTGDIAAAVTIPSRFMNQPLNSGDPVLLTGLPEGWHTVRFAVPAEIQAALLGDTADAFFNFAINKPTCDQPFRLDNVRFEGTLAQRSQFHIRGSSLYDATTSPVGSFDNIGKWSTNVAKSAAPAHVEGAGALAVQANGYTPVTSEWFAVSSLGMPSARLNLDVYLPDPQPNYYWYGDVQLYLDCAHSSNQYIGWLPLTHLFRGEYNSLEYVVPDNVLSYLQGAAETEQCRFVVAINSNASAAVYLDNLGFIH